MTRGSSLASRRRRLRRPLTRRAGSSEGNRGPHSATVVLALGFALGALPALAQSWHAVPSISLEETLTNNASLAPSDLAKSDIVTQLTPSLAFSGKSAHSNVNGSISIPILLYARTGAENNNVYPLCSILGNVEAVEKFLYVDAEVSVTQPFLTPYGAQPISYSSSTQNRYTSSLYRISPYVQGYAPGEVRYELRNNSYWTNLSGAAITTNNSYTSEWLGRIDSPVAPLGWLAEFDLTDVNFSNQSPQRTNLARAGPRYAYDPQLLFQLTGGYEDNHYPLSSYSGYTYGAGVAWRPTRLTSAIANWEHRFFGSSYLLAFDHRTPLSIWSLIASRGITSYPQQVGTQTAGNDVTGLLNQLFSSRITDPNARQDAVSDYISSRGLPTKLAGPVNFYSQQILLAENLGATVGLLGVRNNIFLNVYYLRNEPISGAGNPIPSVLAGANNNTQTGVNLVWTHNLTSLATLSLTANALRTEANGTGPGTTNQGGARLVINAPLSPQTSVFAGARYQILHSDVATPYTEAAVFAGLSYTFH